MPAASTQVSTATLAVPATQNTAPVHEYNCLYTHDIRRKSKRWQDGFLRFHTFNKRVMVYDVSRNFVGDTHWRVDEDLQEGDDVTLDRGGALVQVADQIGKTETDLTGIKKTKSGKMVVEPTEASSPLRVPSGGVVRAIEWGLRQSVQKSTAISKARQPLQNKHRSLNALLGSNRPPIGQAILSDETPFDTRHKQAERDHTQEERALKRQKLHKQHRLPCMMDSHTTELTVTNIRGTHAPQQGQTRKPEIIDISSNGEESDDAQKGTSTKISQLALTSTEKLPTSVTRPSANSRQQQPSAIIEPTTTKLSIRPTGSRRRMLTCMPAEDANSTNRPHDQRTKLQARLAKLADRVARRESVLTISDRSAEQSGPAHRTPAKPGSLTIELNSSSPIKIVPLTIPDVCSDTISEDDSAFETDMRVQPRRKKGELYDLFGTSSASATKGTPVNGPRAVTPERIPFTPMHRSPDPASQFYPFPSTMDIDLVFGQESRLCDASDDTIQDDPIDMQGQIRRSVDALQGGPALNDALQAPPHKGPANSAKHVLQNKVQQRVQDPWSREAFDLFSWRPPGWNEEKWSIAAA